MKTVGKTFADRLRMAIEESGRSVADVAEAAGLDRVTVYQLLRTETDPRWSTVQALAAALGIATDDLRGTHRGHGS
jgi:DNA-binding phage protein